MNEQIRRCLFISFVADILLASINVVYLTEAQENPSTRTFTYDYPGLGQQQHPPYLIDYGKHDMRDVPCNNKHQDPDPPYADLCNHPCNRECFENAEPMVCRYNFRVENYITMSKACYDCPFTKEHCFLKDCVAADGIQRDITVINRQVPGPPIEVCLGDMIEVLVENMMFDESTTIHWHGLHQRGFQYMDGVPKITQCSIPPGTSFLYRFNASKPGTHFYHSHSGLQRGEGMYGALIVRVPLPRDIYFDFYDYDLSDHVIHVLDYIHTTDNSKFLAHHHSDGDNKPETLLINGRGRFQEFENENREILFTPLEKFTVNQGYRYRFRLINAGALNCPIEISIDNHTMVVISSDGSDLEPVEAQSLISYAGERFDFIIEANQFIGNYWMRFRGLMDCDEKYHAAIQGAILHYEGADEKDPPGELSYDIKPSGPQVNLLNSPRNSKNGWLMAEMKSAHIPGRDPTLKPEADVKFYISYDFYQKNNKHFNLANYYGFNQTDKSQRLYTPQLNYISFKFPSFPLMTEPEIAKKMQFCNSSVIPPECETDYCECIHVLKVPKDAVAEVILIDKGFTYDANHPFHLHGYSFRVVGMDRLGSNVTEEKVRQLDAEGKLMRNLKDAPIKDTITVNDGGYTILRFHATNPGYWLFHCHIEFHMEIGMALVFKVGEESDFPPVPENFPTCNNYFPPTKTAAMKGLSVDENYSNEIGGNNSSASDATATKHINSISGAVLVMSLLIIYVFLDYSHFNLL